MVKRQEARKEVPVNKQLVRSESRTQNNKPERPLGASSCRQVDSGAGARSRGHALQALGAQTPVLGGHGRRKAAEGRLGSDTRPTAAGAGSDTRPTAAGTRAASAHVVPTPALPLQPTITSSQLTNAAAGPSWSGQGDLQHSFESSQEVCLSLMFALPNNIQLVVLGFFFLMISIVMIF